jgi:hypothetical protein
MHGQHAGQLRRECHMREVFHRVERELAVERRGNALRDRHDAHRVTVGRRLGAHLHPDVASGARAVVRDELHAVRFRQKLRDHAADDVGRSAGRERNDHAHRLGWILLCVSGIERERGDRGRGEQP